MEKLLQLKTYGLKNIEQPIILDFANQTINNGINKVNNIKGIYGYNGAGKTALIRSMYFYKNIINNADFLVQNDVKKQLKDLINKKINEFYVSTVFDLGKGVIVKHELLLEKNENGLTKIKKENIDLVKGRTLNETSTTLIEKEYNSVRYLPKLKETYVRFINEIEESNSSLLSIYVNRVLAYYESNKIKKLELTPIDQILIQLYLTISTIEVCTLKSDDYYIQSISKEQILELLNRKDELKENLNDSIDYSLDDIVISQSEIESIKSMNNGLIKFIRIFKPELSDIKLDFKPSGTKYHVSRIFVYKDYDVEYTYESSGIKQLTTLYSYLKKCADGKLVFIDEMDVNINTVYFKKLVSYFANFGKGQLIFTTHNIESMDAIKNQRRSINAIGYDGTLDTWVSVGNRSPIKDYMGGYFVHSPMNIEDFDFISIFEGE